MRYMESPIAAVQGECPVHRGGGASHCVRHICHHIPVRGQKAGDGRYNKLY
ncbi:hypothetical protein GDO81_018442 [Engystomops pustulosus]|uniref:Uncharacterized protein n=1 Tax=Engystomops pustulosus TaxID=76066 RepID=A0AAV6ZNY4_ENGPU|nr:hypothetical protein GDO81_018442 [Engystomops pustulosus]